MSKLQPIGDKLLVRPSKEEEKTSGGIVLPDSAKEKSQEGEVIAVGKGKYIDNKLIALEVKPGDKILFSKYGGDEIKHNGEELKIISESDILAIIKN